VSAECVEVWEAIGHDQARYFVTGQSRQAILLGVEQNGTAMKWLAKSRIKGAHPNLELFAIAQDRAVDPDAWRGGNDASGARPAQAGVQIQQLALGGYYLILAGRSQSVEFRPPLDRRDELSLEIEEHWLALQIGARFRDRRQFPHNHPLGEAFGVHRNDGSAMTIEEDNIATDATAEAGAHLDGGDAGPGGIDPNLNVVASERRRGHTEPTQEVRLDEVNRNGRAIVLPEEQRGRKKKDGAFCHLELLREGVGASSHAAGPRVICRLAV
jgi:hypothetical protein